MGDDHDRGEPADVVPDPALWLCAVLLARGGPQGGHDGTHLPRDHTVRADPGGGAGLALDLPGYRDADPGPDP